MIMNILLGAYVCISIQDIARSGIAGLLHVYIFNFRIIPNCFPKQFSETAWKTDGAVRRCASVGRGAAQRSAPASQLRAPSWLGAPRRVPLLLQPS